MKKMRNTQRGSVLIFLFIGIILFAALALAVSQGFRLSEGSTGMASEEKARLDASNVLDFARAVQNGVQEMKLNGVVTSAIDFVRPGDEPAYSTAPHTAKIFHPNGGKVTFIEAWSSLGATDWYFVENTVEGIGGSGDELILSLLGVSDSMCSQINEILTGSNAVPAAVADIHDMFELGTSLVDSAECAPCVGKAAMCVSGGGGNAFYFVLDRG